MSSYQAPGVYSKIKTNKQQTIESAGTGVCGFIGQISEGPEQKATLVTTWAEYQKKFGGLEAGGVLARSVYGYFLNGGGKAYIVNVGAPKEGQTEEEVVALIQGEDKGPGRRSGLALFKPVDDINLVAAPGQTSQIAHRIIADHASECGNRMAILDGPEELGETSLEEFPRLSACDDAALYWPWIEVFDSNLKKTVMVPPSGHIAGCISRVDSTRGVHKAPANEVIRGAVGLKYSLTREEQSLLNPRGINLVRDLDDLGIRIYGARTLSDSKEWRYVNIRRLFLDVKQAITKGTEWVVFEPNNQRLWSKIELSVRSYLKGLYKKGAFQGTTPEEGFYVACNQETNTPEDLENGVVNVEIGIAPVKPAEFVSISLQQKL